MTGSPSPARPSNLGLWSATALVVGHTIGVGVFLTPSQLLGALGSPAWTLGLWFACGALVLAGALTFGELASRHPRSGGLYVYLREGYGPRAGFLYGWQALLVMDPGVTASLALGAAEYVGVLWPGAAGHPKGVALGAIWILAGLSLADLRLGARAMQALTALKSCSRCATCRAIQRGFHGNTRLPDVKSKLNAPCSRRSPQ